MLGAPLHQLDSNNTPMTQKPQNGGTYNPVSPFVGFMVLEFRLRLGWWCGCRVSLVMVRSHTVDGGDSNSIVVYALTKENLIYALGL
ncbi:hypothetical protein JHK82_039885 [Glycine max]|nr:hypothetical protein JHK86_040082 [Glycine max]KAG4965686.1 hypothetical protein JHK85_040661 [Glycine max]KAG5110662.1 hypothetical protein JHK82_039885 [Glycine max]KAG5121952.1 hypothetical protein JHK84_040292 [Glycine max]